MLRILLLTVLAALTGCTSLDPPATPAPVETLEVPSAPAPTERPLVRTPLPTVSEPRGSAPEPPPVVTAPATPTSTLLTQIDAALSAGELDRAGAFCERALRIAPRDAQLWYKLASIRILQLRYDDADGTARRALSFAGADAALTQAINALLAQVAAARDAP